MIKREVYIILDPIDIRCFLYGKYIKNKIMYEFHKAD
jgi:hypothetical protein